MLKEEDSSRWIKAAGATRSSNTSYVCRWADCTKQTRRDSQDSVWLWHWRYLWANNSIGLAIHLSLKHSTHCYVNDFGQPYKLVCAHCTTVHSPAWVVLASPTSKCVRTAQTVHAAMWVVLASLTNAYVLTVQAGLPWSGTWPAGWNAWTGQMQAPTGGGCWWHGWAQTHQTATHPPVEMWEAPEHFYSSSHHPRLSASGTETKLNAAPVILVLTTMQVDCCSFRLE